MYLFFKNYIVKFFLFILCFFCFSSRLIAQNGGVPQAMKYQSVARDKFGIGLKFKKVGLRISLSSKKYGTPVIYYVETQEAITNELGLFSISIGEGTVLSGIFSNVPWFTDDIWMNVDTKDEDWKPYTNISSSRLLTVPYAFHANSASHIMGIADGNLANIWSLKGNRNINPQTDRLGNLDSLDLNMVTNNQTRLSVFANGLIYMPGSLHIGKDLDVEGNTHLNSNVYLNSTLGNTFINSLTQSTAPENGALVILGGLGVGKNVNLGQHLTVADTVILSANRNSNSIHSGTLVVSGGIGVGQNATIGQNVTIGQHLTVADTALFTATKNSKSAHSGALVVSGGAGIARDVNIGGALSLTDSLLILKDNQSVNPASGALVIRGGAGIGKRLNVKGGTRLNDSLNVTTSNSYVANFINKSNGNGILIKVGSQTPSSVNTFVSFENQNGDEVGSIKGQTLSELHADPDYKSNLKDQDIAVASATFATAQGIFSVAQATVTQIASDASTTGCFGLGACETVPIPSFIVSSGVNLATSIAAAVVTAGEMALAVLQRQKFIDNADKNVGVTYSSGAGDYAEWLPRLNATEKFRAGNIVAIRNGAITLQTTGAMQLLVISDQPIVLGNTPAQVNKSTYEKVAFMGQVPVMVFGKVYLGDFIVPDNQNDGGGRAISAANMTPGDYKNIVGVAWTSSTNTSFNYINVAIGLNSNATARIITEQSGEIKQMAAEIEEIKKTLSKLVNNSMHTATKPEIAVKNAGSSVPDITLPKVLFSKAAVSTLTLKPNIPLVTTDENRIQYYQISSDQIDDIWMRAEKQFIDNGGDRKNVFWLKYDSDAAYRTEIKRLFALKINNGLIEQKIINRQYSPKL